MNNEDIRIGIQNSMPSQAAILEAISIAVGDSFPKNAIIQTIGEGIAAAFERPSVAYRPKLSMTNSHHPMWHEGKRWLAEYGDLQVIGSSPSDAMSRFDEEWREP